VTTAELGALIEQCGLGLDAELVLLVRLQDIVVRQHETTQIGDIAGLQRAADQRDALTSELMAVERQVRPAYERLTRAPAAASRPKGFDHAVALRLTFERMVNDILGIDRESIRALEQIVAARRTAAHAAEQAETTLTAYGRVAAPPPTATLVNRRG
jgi:hypothetical protein